ncbi:rab-GTPase-TBC domain-containing protein, partial [Mucidula mucida]
KAFHDLFNPSTSLAKTRDAALSDRLFRPSSDGLDIPGRSLAWKLFLLPSEPLKTPVEADASFLLVTLRSSRKRYMELSIDKLRAPDGGYEEGFTVPGSQASPKRVSKPDINLERNNPLSLHTENPWTEWFASVELRKTILQDVERTFPEVEFFRLPEVQTELTSILFIYSDMNPSIGYRQGMHELLAPLYYAVYSDAISSSEAPYIKDNDVKELCARPWVAADSWALFEAMMRGTSRWYEWREPTQDVTNKSPLNTHVTFNVSQARGSSEIKPYITPIVQTCNDIQANLLRITDFQLWQRLQTTGIEPQIYGIRWLRLLFTREFSLPDAMKLWDALFACDASFDLAPWICVAMLIRIRNDLLPSDYTGQLTSLLRYSSPQWSQQGVHVNHVSLLVRQALALQMSPTPATGVSLISENWSLLDIPMDVPEPPPAPRRKIPPPTIRGRSSSVYPAGPSSHAAPTHTRQQSSQQIGFSDMLGGILERGESLGINKSLMSAVTELKRNIPDIASSLIRSPTATSTSFPLAVESSGEKPPWEHRSRLDMEREIASLRVVNKRLGDSLSWIVDVLLLDESGTPDPGLLKKKRREAVESLAYVRDVLVSNATDVEEDRLIGEEERKQRKAKAKMRENREPDVTAPSLPTPVPVVDSHSGREALASAGTSRGVPRSLDISNISNDHSLSRKPSDPSARIAPWNYTRSNFATPPSAVEAALPRPPPPSSTIIRPNADNRHTRKDSAPVLQDPLGALH